MIDPFWYATSSTLEWSPSIKGPKKKPDPKSANEMEGQVVPRLLLLVVF